MTSGLSGGENRKETDSSGIIIHESQRARNPEYSGGRNRQTASIAAMDKESTQPVANVAA